jgi:hypothetical protein
MIQKRLQGGISLLTTQITYDRIKENIPSEINKATNLIFKKIKENPQEAIDIIENLIKKYPNVPMLTNWHIAACQNAGKGEKTINALIEEYYKKHPNYLFSKCSYAELCFQKGQWERVSEIFNNNYILDKLYPDRKIFHITEVLYFYTTIGKYFCYKQDLDSAKIYLSLLEKLEADKERFYFGFLALFLQKFPSQMDQYTSKVFSKDILNTVFKNKK